eukprot:TRINITY_DN32748_c0_g1_i1.p1 TRINITY_DN32748_c0_g1~~TRINITY_DN32748_c0_g1_i1.p1  ORF type:complete len:196 (+),score=30.12 TRINITY_DN32748_c0_g1_i1:25-612(+)
MAALIFAAASILQTVLAGPEVTPAVLEARGWNTWAGPNGKMANSGPAELFPIVSPGDIIFLRAYHGRHLDVDPKAQLIKARRNSHGAGQAWTIDKREAGDVRPGDRIFVTASSGMRIEVNGEQVSCKSTNRGPKQEFIIERLSGGLSPIAVGDIIFLKSHTGKHLDVVENDVRARFNAWETGFGYHTLVVEKPSR